MATTKIQVTALAHVHYQHPDLSKAITFFADFGFVEAATSDNPKRIYYRGFGPNPYLYIAEQSPDSKRHFLGGTWVTESLEDLHKAAKHPSASGIRDNDGPGGGQIVTLTDPNGFPVSFIHGQTMRTPDTDGTSYFHEETGGVVANTAVEKPRKGAFRRFQPGPSPVNKAGHYGFIVPKSRYRETLAWYLELINLTPTDVVFDGESGEDETSFNHIDLGEVFTDHHSFFVGAGPEEVPPHVHHSSFEVNDFDTQTLGHDWLREKGWTNCWGIGRHVLGSQIFDYWFDASGNIAEHYSDGDQVNCHSPVSREAATPNTLFIWGPNIPLGFLTGRVEDAGKPLPPPAGVVIEEAPDVIAGVAAKVKAVSVS
jgi:hypothetical protein